MLRRVQLLAISCVARRFTQVPEGPGTEDAPVKASGRQGETISRSKLATTRASAWSTRWPA
jgi:hypothetical protein